MNDSSEKELHGRYIYDRHIQYVDFAEDYICFVYEGVNRDAPR